MRVELHKNRFFGRGGAGKKRWIPIWIAMVWVGMGMGFSSVVRAADVVWNFGTTGTFSPTSGTPITNLTISDIAGTGALTAPGSTGSSGYSGVSGGYNIGFSPKSGVLDTGTSAYFQFILTPVSNASFLLSAVSFGTRSTSTGPKNYALRCSLDNYATDIVSGSASADTVWYLKSHGGLSVASSSPVTFRVYGFGGTSTASNWKVDDVKISVSDISGPVVYANGSLNPFSSTSGTASSEQTFSVSGYNLIGDLTVAPPAGFEIKTAGDYTSLPLTILRSGVSVTPTTVTIRVAAATPANPSLSGNVTVSSSGASDKTLAVSGTVLPDTSPFISVSTNALPAFSASSGSVSASQSFTTAAKNLTNEFTVTAPDGFQVSTNGVDFASSLTLAQTNGLSTNTVSVRVAGTNSASSFFGNVVMASAGASSANVAVTATVTNPTITVSMNPALMYENATSTGTVTLPAPRIADLTINLNSGTPTAATVPLSVILSAGQTSVNFTVTAVPDSASYAERSSLITASATNCTNGSATVIVLNADPAPITPISLDGSNGNSYSQNFNGLGTNNIPSVFPASNGVQVSLGAITTNTVNGWYGAKIAGTGTSATDLLANAGTTSTGTLYSFGNANDVNRAVGTIATGTTTMAFGALIKNNMRGTITNVKVSFTAEFWRNAIPSSSTGSAETNVLVFGYGKIDGTSNSVSNFLISSNALSQTNLNITGPAPVAYGTTPVNLDGSLPANQVQFSNVAVPLSLAAGEMAFVRWQDKDNAGLDAGIGLDNFVLSYEVNGISNSAPTQIGLSATAIAENNAVNAVVGTLSTTDSDAGDTFTYDLVAGTGGDDNGLFNISGSNLRAGVAFNFEALSSYSIRVRTTDSGGGTFEKVFTITVTNSADSPAEYKADWLAANGLPDNSDWNSDPNSVGYSLATAYAFGLSAIVNSGAPTTIVSSPAGSLKIVYMQRNSISGIIYAVKSGTDLAAGLSGNDAIINVSANQPSPAILGYTRYEATYTPSAPATKAFLKVQAEVP